MPRPSTGLTTHRSVTGLDRHPGVPIWAGVYAADSFVTEPLLFSMAQAGQHGLSAVWLQATDFESVVVDIYLSVLSVVSSRRGQDVLLPKLNSKTGEMLPHFMQP